MKVVRRALTSGRAAFACLQPLDAHGVEGRIMTGKSFLRSRGVSTRTGLSRTTIWRLIKAKKFPRPVPITDSGYAVGWVESEVEAWMQARIEQRDQQEARR